MCAPVLSILLAFSILGAAIGVPLTRHICHMSETLSVNIGAEEHGCEDPATETCTAEGNLAKVIEEESCCHFSITHEKADLKPLLKVADNWVAAPAILSLAAFNHNFLQIDFAPEEEVILCASDSSPPLAGRRLLTFISVLII